MIERHEIVLSGLIGSKPIGAMAAFGLLRWCDEIDALRDSTLHWVQEDDWIAVLGTPRPVSADGLCEALLADLASRERYEHLDWSRDGKLRVPAAEFRARCDADSAASGYSNRLVADFDAAYGCAACTDAKGRVSPTRLDMTSGQQCFLQALMDLGSTLRPDGRERGRQTPDALMRSVREALIGPWTYPDPEHSLGWDGDAERMHALRAQAPTAESGNKSVRFAVWLAHYALALLPSVPVRGRLATVALAVARRQPARFRWPIWDGPLGTGALRSLLSSSDLIGHGEALERLRSRGVGSVYESLRHDFGKGRGVFRPARRVEVQAVVPPRPAAPLIL